MYWKLRECTFQPKDSWCLLFERGFQLSELWYSVPLHRNMYEIESTQHDNRSVKVPLPLILNYGNFFVRFGFSSNYYCKHHNRKQNLTYQQRLFFNKTHSSSLQIKFLLGYGKFKISNRVACPDIVTYDTCSKGY